MNHRSWSCGSILLQARINMLHLRLWKIVNQIMTKSRLVSWLWKKNWSTRPTTVRLCSLFSHMYVRTSFCASVPKTSKSSDYHCRLYAGWVDHWWLLSWIFRVKVHENSFCLLSMKNWVNAIWQQGSSTNCFLAHNLLPLIVFKFTLVLVARNIIESHLRPLNCSIFCKYHLSFIFKI